MLFIDNLIFKLIKFLLIYLVLASLLNVAGYLYGGATFISSINEIIVVVITILFCFSLLKVKRIDKSLKIVLILLCYYVLYIVISVLIGYINTHNILISMNVIRIKVFPIIMGIICLILGYNYPRKIEEIKKKFWSFCIFFSYLNSIFVILQFNLGWETITKIVFGKPMYAFDLFAFTHSGSLFRVPGFFENALASGFFGTLVFIYCLVSFYDNRKIINIIHLIPSTVIIIMSFNRQIYLVAIITFVCILLWKSSKNLLISMTLLIFSLSLIVLPVLGQSKIGIFTTDSIKMRGNVWTEVIDDLNLNNNPFFILTGKGSGTSGEAININSDKLNKNKINSLSFVDNNFISIFHDEGIIGFLLFMIINLVLLYIVLKNKNSFSALFLFVFILSILVRMMLNSVLQGQLASYVYWMLISFYIVEVINENKNINNKLRRIHNGGKSINITRNL